MKDQQTRVYHVYIFSRYVADVVHRLVDAGICIQVRAEFDTFRFAPGHDAKSGFITREVLCSVESHVLQKVSQTTLLRFLKNGTYFLGDVEFNSFFGKGVVANVIGKPVV